MLTKIDPTALAAIVSEIQVIFCVAIAQVGKFSRNEIVIAHSG
jgi:hypothetical protein